MFRRATQILEARREEVISWLIHESGSTRLKATLEWATGWLQGSGVALDQKQFIRTGTSDQAQKTGAGGNSGRPLPLESSIPGVFAVGDVRSGSVKRVGGAIGEGAAVVAQLHTVLSDAAVETRSR